SSGLLATGPLRRTAGRRGTGCGAACGPAAGAASRTPATAQSAPWAVEAASRPSRGRRRRFGAGGFFDRRVAPQRKSEGQPGNCRPKKGDKYGDGRDADRDIGATKLYGPRLAFPGFWFGRTGRNGLLVRSRLKFEYRWRVGFGRL